LEAIILRSIERIVAVIIGGLSIYLGYRLFLAIPERHESEGKVLLPGGISIYMTRIGPGAFFALFGAIVVAISFHQAITYREGPYKEVMSRQSTGTAAQSDLVQPGGSSTYSRSYTGFGSGDATENLQLSRLQAASDIRFLNNTLSQWLRNDLSRQNRTDVALVVQRMRLAIVTSVWGPDWGEIAKFNEWVRNGASEPPPKELDKPARLYLHGEV